MDKRNNKKPKDLINQFIPFRELLVITDEGEKLGVMSKRDALALAEQKNLDLVCISPNAKPAVCKILDYGKYKYEMKKKNKEAKKNQHVTLNKEIRLTPNIGDHDLQTKAKKAIQFLEEKNRVKVSLKFKGREMQRTEFGKETLMKFFGLVEEVAIIEKQPKMYGRFYDMYLGPKKAK